MRLRAVGALVCLSLLAASCGDDRAAPTSPTTPVSLSIVSAASSLAIGESQRLQAIVRHADGTTAPASGPVSWRSSNEAVLSTWADGVVVAVAPGPATVTAAADGLSASAGLTVIDNDHDLRHVAGRVTDFASQAGVAGARLRFRHAGVGLAFDAGETETDGAGNYSIALRPGDYSVEAGGSNAAVLVVRVGSPAFRGDFYVNGGPCIARYGTVIDAATFRPLAGATVRYGGGIAVTSADGSYRIDHACPGTVSGNTITVGASHPGYASSSRFSGRGLSGVVRLDFALTPS